MANGDDASSSTPAHDTHRAPDRSPSPTSRRPTSHISGSDATANRPDSARAATSPVPAMSIQPWRSR